MARAVLRVALGYHVASVQYETILHARSSNVRDFRDHSASSMEFMIRTFRKFERCVDVISFWFRHRLVVVHLGRSRVGPGISMLYSREPDLVDPVLFFRVSDGSPEFRLRL